MPDTTSRLGSYRRPLRRLLGSALIFLASLLMVVSMGVAQEDLDCDDFATPEDAQSYFDSQESGNPYRLDADSDGLACEEPGEGDDDSSQESVFEPTDDDSASGDQYEDEDQQQAVQTPRTGGPALLPLAGALMLLGSGGYFLFRR